MIYADVSLSLLFHVSISTYCFSKDSALLVLKQIMKIRFKTEACLNITKDLLSDVT